MIKHCDRSRDRGRMGVRHVDSAGAELNLPGCRSEPGDECYAGSDVLGSVGDVLADISLGEPEFIGQKEGLAILVERKPPVLLYGMDWHRKEPELHGLLFPKKAGFGWQRTCVLRRAKTRSK